MTNWDSYEEVNAFVMDHEIELMGQLGRRGSIESVLLGGLIVRVLVDYKGMLSNYNIRITDLKKLGTEVIDDNDNGFRRGE